jgi:hypothetical protein
MLLALKSSSLTKRKEKAMSEHESRRKLLMRRVPVVGIFLWEWEIWRRSQSYISFSLAPQTENGCELRPFPIDLRPVLDLQDGPLDESGVPYFIPREEEFAIAGYHPTYIAEFALAQWNEYLRSKKEEALEAFLTQARWLVVHETRIVDGVGGWPLPFPCHDFYASEPWLSALTQGYAIAVLVRAYRVTSEDKFLEVAHRAVRTFELDIWEGGVSAKVGEHGIFFEEVAVYPPAHILNGYILSLFGLYDYVALTNDIHIARLIQRSVDTLHTLLDDFDLGYGSRYDLLLRRPSSPYYHALHVLLLEALAQYSGCQHCAALSARWESYEHGIKPLINHGMSRLARYRRGISLAITGRKRGLLGEKREQNFFRQNDVIRSNR